MRKILVCVMLLGIAAVYADSFDGMLKGTDSAEKVTQNGDGKCVHYADITVITKIDTDIPGEQILVKNAPDANCEWEAESNWLVDSGVASYFKGKSKNWLIVERGTSVDNRDVLVYDTVTHELTFSDTYAEPMKISDDKLIYWRNVGIIASSENCDKYDEAQKLSLSAQLQAYTSVDLSKTTLKPTINKTNLRCEMMQ